MLFSIKLCLYLLSFKVLDLHMTITLAEVYIYISSTYSNLNFAHYFIIYWLLHRVHKNYTDSQFLQNWENLIGWAKYVYVYKWDMCWRNFCVFSWWPKNVKARPKFTPFFNWHILKFDFQKKTITLFKR